jgi:hypothetical protein
MSVASAAKSRMRDSCCELFMLFDHCVVVEGRKLQVQRGNGGYKQYKKRWVKRAILLKQRDSLDTSFLKRSCTKYNPTRKSL